MLRDETIEDAYPCSPLQEGLMGLAIRQPGSYITHRSQPLPPDINVNRFKAAWERTISQCSNLRTRIIMCRVGAVQIVWENDISWDDLSLSPQSSAGQDLHVAYGTRLNRYSISRDPTSGRFHFIWVMHHSIFDGWTVRAILELLYQQYYHLEAPPITPAPYSGYIRYIKSSKITSSVEYWRSQLSGAKRATFPPNASSDRHKEGIAGHYRHEISLPGMKQESMTMATVLRTTWAILLSRYCDTNDICFGTTVSGRQAPVASLDRMLGPVIATVPVRIRIEPSQPISQILLTVQNQAVEMVKHEHFGLQNIAKLNPDAKDACDFSSLFLIQPAIDLTPRNGNDGQILAFGNLAEEAMQSFFNYPLLVQAQISRSNDIELIMTYDSGLLQEFQIQALCHQFDCVLQQLARSTASDTVGSVSVAGDWDLQQAIRWNGTKQVKLLDGYRGFVHEFISDRALKQPDCEAIYTSAGSLTYHQLEVQSTKFANLLQLNGVKQGMIVPICLEKSIWAVVAILGILKAGGAFLPLDPSHPKARRQGLIHQVNAQHLIVSPLDYAANKDMAKNVLQIHENFDTPIPSPKSSNYATNLTSNSPIYVLFTSGSTGTPKGVLVEHGAATKSILQQILSFGFGKHTRTIQFAAFTFDVALIDIFGTLIAGGTLCIPNSEERLYNTDSYIEEACVNTAFLSPSFLQTLNPEKVPSLKVVVLGGEAATPDLIQRWNKHVRLINTYGLTESCIWNTIHEFGSGDESPRNIGRSFNSNCWIVDHHNNDRLAPIGCEGELVLHGPCLARGYVNDALLTDNLFKQSFRWLSMDLSTGGKHWRFLKTGDLARYTPNGDIELIGRRDTQVKLRGRRIELHEIESVIKSVQSDFTHVAVDLVHLRERDHLVAFTCSKPQINVDTPEQAVALDGSVDVLTAEDTMREGLAEKLGDLLPTYMIPSFILPIKSMPFTTSLKLDRKKLRAYAQRLPSEKLGEFTAEESEKAPPITDMEHQLRDLWADVLQIKADDIGRRDSFMKIGGDSISVISLTSLARKQGIKLSAACIFEMPRLSEMALAAVRTDCSTTTITTKQFSMIPTKMLNTFLTTVREKCDLQHSQEIEDAFPCTPLQEGLMGLSIKDPGSYLTRRVIRLREHVSIAKFRLAWDKTVIQCANLRTRIVTHDGKTFQVIVKDDISWQHTAISGDPSTALRNVGIGYGSRLCYYELVEGDGDAAYFALCLQHAIYDGWAIRIVLDVLQRAYDGNPPLILQPYSSFIERIHATDTSSAQTYWQEQLAGAKGATFPGRPISATATERKTPAMDHSKTYFSMPLPKDAQFTKATVLRAAWAIVLAEYCDTADICFGATVSGRQTSAPGIELMAGPTIATVPVRIKLAKESTVSSLLLAVQHQASKMIVYEQFGMRNISRLSEDIREACNFTSLLVIQPHNKSVSTSDRPALLPLGTVVDEAANMFAKHPLVVQVGLTESDSVELAISYDCAVLTTEEVVALSHQIGHVALQLVHQQDQRLASVSVAGSWDLRQTQKWNNELQLRNDQACVLDLISMRVEQTPYKEAIYSTNSCLSYSELDRQATKFAFHLVQIGVRRGTIIPICFEKSLWAVIAILGVLKVGGVYVPLDAASPIGRRKGLVEQVDAAIIVVSPLQEISCKGLANRIVVISEELLRHVPEQDTIVRHDLSPSDPAYVFFTSGTTGKPKGIVVHHRALSCSIKAHSIRYGISNRTRLFEFSHYNFDVNVMNIFCTLTEGGTICIPTEEERLYTPSDFMTKTRVDFACFAPSFARTIRPQSVPHLKTLLVGGEALAKDVQEMWCNKVKLINGYGPTETTISCVAYDVVSSNRSPNVIGKPFANDCYVVNPDDHNRLTAIGCVGELIIHGHNVAQGYFNNKEITKQVFLEGVDFLGPELCGDTQRFYKTGDLVKYLPDGNILYLGRKDTQVKIRGKRIEIGEIEATMKGTISGVKHVAVELVRLNTREALVGFVCFDLETTELQRDTLEKTNHPDIIPLDDAIKKVLLKAISSMKETLPAYMIPSIFIPLRIFPFFSSLKLDRKTLQGIATCLDSKQIAAFNLASKSKVPPSTDMEMKLQVLWAQVLKIRQEEIGKHDSFLQIGGDSISAIELATISKEKGINITVANVFEAPQLESLAAIAVKNSQGISSDNVEIHTPFGLVGKPEMKHLMGEIKQQCGLPSTAEIEDVFPCTPLQEGLMALAEKHPGSYVGKQLYEIPRHVDIELFKWAWDQTIQLCCNLRTRLVWLKSKSWQVLLKTTQDWEVMTLKTATDVMDSLSNTKMRYGAPLCRYSLVRSDSVFYFAISIHHAVFDGWTVNIIMDTLHRMYYRKDVPHLQPYSNFINYTLSVDATDAQEYWKRQLEGAEGARFPPRSNQEIVSGRTSMVKKKVAFGNSRETSITKASILRAAWAIVMAQYGMTDDICFGATVSGRLASVPGIAHMTGLTIATVPVRVKLDSQQSVLSFLQDIQHQSSDMVAYEQLGLQNIAKVSHFAKMACEFNSLFVVQPVQRSQEPGHDGKRILQAAEISEQVVLDSADSYFNFPLTAQCFLSEKEVELHLTFQRDVLSKFEVTALSNHFSHVFSQLLSQGGTPLGKISVSGKWDADTKAGWQNTDQSLVIVDPRNHHNLAPIGCIGELLYIGTNVSVKYPDSTELNFEDNADWATSLLSDGRKAFRTGHLARYSETGTIIAMGKLEGAKTRQSRVVVQDSLQKYPSARNKRSSMETEARLSALWAQVLGLDVEDVSQRDNFLEIGGDSINAIELVALAQRQGINLTVPMVFRNPELASMARAAAANLKEITYEASPFSLIESPLAAELESNVVTSCGLSSGDEVEDLYPCTALQTGLMALTVTQPGSYVNKSVFKVDKATDTERFMAAWNQTVATFTNLRTRIILDSGRALQVITKKGTAWELNPLDPKVENIRMGYGQPLYRYGLDRDAQGDEVFVLVMHHAIYDGWTMNLMANAFRRAYSGETGTQLQPYASFIKYTLSLDSQDAASYWTAYLDGATPSSFPDSKLTRKKGMAGGSGTLSKRVLLPKALESPATKATLVQAAWTLLLSRYCNSNDVCFGTTVSGRQAPVYGLNNMPGPTVATIPVRVRLERLETMSQLLSALQEDSSNCVPHEQFGVQNIAKVSPEAQAACTFSNLLVIQPGFEGSTTRPGDPMLLQPQSTESTVGDMNSNFFNYPLVIQAFLSEDEVEFFFMYDRSVITAQQLEAVSNQLDHVLKQMCDKKDGPLSEISLVGPWDMEHAIQGSALREPTHACTHWQILEQIQNRPNDEAISAWNQTLTYAELGALASRLAEELVRSGVGSSSPVAVCFEKSSWAVVAMLAIQYAGGSIVPVDSATPMHRRAVIIQETRSRFALVSRQFHQTFRDMGILTFVVDDEAVSSLPGAEQFVPPGIQPSNVSVTLFTSGSTGKPKGILLTHENICSSADGYGAQMSIGPGTRVFQFSSYAFDVAILDIFTTLIRGGCLCIPSDHDRMYDLAGAIMRSEANWAFLTPTVANTLSPKDVPCLTALCLGGEAVSETTIQQWRDHDVQLYIGYGPAESSICSWNSCIVTAETPTNIGRPISSAFWVIEPSNERKLVPVGCVGELLIQGPLLAKGYLNSDATSNGKWLENIDWLPKGFPSRGFLTGDLVQRNADGTFDYIGRKDTQVKLHGQRIELAEIEHHLSLALPETDAVFVDLVQWADNQALTAFIGLHRDADRTKLASIAPKLCAALPSAMIPKYYLPFQKMPMTLSGKLDRASLRKTAAEMTPAQLLQFTSTGYRSSRPCGTELELSIRHHWSEVLGIPESTIGAEDNFYHLGGDSIRIVTLAQRILKAYGVTLGLWLINSKDTTIASMAELIESTAVGEGLSKVPTLDLEMEFASIVNQAWNLRNVVDSPVTKLPENATVFLTGGTGYLGTETLRQLLASDNICRVIILVRAKSTSHGLDRVKRTAQIAGWWDSANTDKITIWQGDLAKPNLGLSEDNLRHLQGKSTTHIHAIIHNGAVVNWNADYNKLRRANVDSTVQLLRIATSSTATKFVFVSGGMKETDQYNNEDLFAKLLPKGGYAQTKIMAERVILEMASRLPALQNRISVVKPGLIIGPTQTGVANIDDFLWRAAATAVSMGKCPLEGEAWLHIANVEYVSGIIINQLFSSEICTSVDMLEGMYMSTFWDLIHQELCLEYDTIPFPEWVKLALEQVNIVGERHPLWAAQHFLTQPDGQSSRPDGYVTPQDMCDAVRSNVRYLEGIGFIRRSVRGLGIVNGDVIGRSNMADYEESGLP